LSNRTRRLPIGSSSWFRDAIMVVVESWNANDFLVGLRCDIGGIRLWFAKIDGKYGPENESVTVRRIRTTQESSFGLENKHIFVVLLVSGTRQHRLRQSKNFRMSFDR
jgi:hypothetical protein